MLAAMTTDPGARAQRTYRQRSQLALGWSLVGLCGLLLLSVAARWPADRGPAYLAWLVLAASLGWVLLIRPHVRVDRDGVTLANLVRDVSVPWSLLDDVDCRWNLTLYAGERRFVSWALGSEIKRPRAQGISLFGGGTGGRLAQYAEQMAPGSPSLGSTKRGVAGRALELIETTRADYADAVAEGALTVPSDAAVVQRVQLVAVAALLVPIVAVVLLR